MAPSSSFFFFFFFFVTLHRLPVIREDDFGTEMFFVVSGSCQCLVKRKVVRIFRENEMFGEIALLKTEPVRRTATIKSELYSELVVLNKTDFLDCLAIHPSASKKVYAVMREKIDGYTGANRKSLDRSASINVREKLSSARGNESGGGSGSGSGSESSDDEIEDDKDFIKRLPVKRANSYVAGLNRGPSISPLRNNVKSTPEHSTFDESLTIEEFLENRSAQFDVDQHDLLEFVHEYTSKLHNQEIEILREKKFAADIAKSKQKKKEKREKRKEEMNEATS